MKHSVTGHGNYPMPKKGEGSKATVGMDKKWVKTSTGNKPMSHSGGAGGWNGYKGK